MVLYARVSSLQEESPATPSEFFSEVNAKATSAKVVAVAFCIWPFPNPVRPTQYPGPDDYLEFLRAKGWDFIACVVLGQTPYRPLLPRVKHLPDVLIDPINVSAEKVRKHFGWR